MRKDPDVFLEHIRDSIEQIEAHLRHCTKTTFLHSTTVQDVVVRRLEVIGEAVKNLSPSFRTKHADIPWKSIAGLRDVLIHGYFGVDYDLVWKITKKNIPSLKKKVVKLLNE